MTAQSNEKGQKAQAKEEKKDEQKNWGDHLNDFIKNPIVTGIGGFLAGYMAGAQKANSELEECKRREQERDQQFALLLQQMQQTNKYLASAMGALPDGDDGRTLHFEKDPKDNTYKRKQKNRYFKL